MKFATIKKNYKSEKNNATAVINSASKELESLDFDELTKLANVLNRLQKRTGANITAEITAERIQLAADWSAAKYQHERDKDELAAASNLK